MKNSQIKAQEIASREEVTIEIQKLISTDKHFFEKLVNFAKKFMGHYGNVIPYLEPVDFVYSALEKLLVGARSWNKARFPEILDLILNIIKSEIRNEIKKYSGNEKGNIKKYYFESIYKESEEGFLKYENLVDTSIDLENDIIIENILEQAADILKRKGDEEAFLVLECKIKGMKNKEIAEYLNVEVSGVENAVKRIKRVIKNLDKIRS